MINFQNVTKIYDKVNKEAIGIEDVTFQIEAGEFVSLVGKSGAGKSTILKLLIGEEKPTRGRILVGEYEVNKLKNNELPHLRRQIGVVFQDFKLLPSKTAYENIAFALEAAGRPQSEIEEFVPQVLDMVGLSHKKYNFPHELSGGEKQRVAIARAMIHNPAVIVADEPTGNLDDINTEEIIKLLMRINELGTTVIFASHNKDVINKVNKRVISLVDGRLVRDEAQGKYIIM
ncbi:MAG: cell division ATP-binding protein FtsE [Candidatus Harrisonbacteria bacterium CG10_big_fil_rev_8_21_14_0_10_44_23]|uniref:Cell division ATP-binding protein FtsE n=1 Tax=Candidatus Harrisonbacteria bacterium CG10_big_fil_rev_8_21_14_0_10_44_23 TaxID=1974585 RepID=A0A2H0UQG9_9BACT|nr:MAG: cell division ATP-binding protein FtsE [Candidatus Harrisonbacteria bacterium CG10_big_fil_rev_8_21_14_0_10_44_23]